MSAVNNQVITCPVIDPTSKQTSNFLLQVWAGNGGKGVMNDSLPVDTKTGLISSTAIAGQVQSLINTGVIPTAPMNENGTVNMDGLMQQDGQLYANLQSEFCWYESRYIYALNQFLQSATLRQATDATQANDFLAITQQLNKRANSVLQIISYLAQTRVGNILSSKTSIDGLNVDINKKLAKLQAGYSLLNKDNAIVTTQKEMVRFTEEKNNYTSNRIIVWTALNVLALGAIFYVYQKA